MFGPLIPINIGNYHWVLMVVYPQRGLMEYYNSMAGVGQMHFGLLVLFLKERAENDQQRNLSWMLELDIVPAQASNSNYFVGRFQRQERQ